MKKQVVYNYIGERLEYATILDTLKDNGIMTIERRKGKFCLTEACDAWFYLDLTPEQLVDLGYKLIDMAKREASK